MPILRESTSPTIRTGGECLTSYPYYWGMRVKLLTWNLAGRVRKLPLQVETILRHNPDLLCLQEVTKRTNGLLKDALQDHFEYVASSFTPEVSDHDPKGPRKYGQLIASKFPIIDQPTNLFDVPWRERVTTVVALVNGHELEIHTTHIPPGSSNGFIKVEMLEGIYEYFKHPSQRTRLLCGDFNTPKDESVEFGALSFKQYLTASGELRTRRGEQNSRWDLAERNIITGLRTHGMPDSFRTLHPYETVAHSFIVKNRGNLFPRRFDHVFATTDLQPVLAEYQEDEKQLSDHLGLVVEYDWQV